VGDYVMLHWSDRSMDTWQASTGTAVDPGNLAQHTMDSCYAIPMIAPTAKALASVSGSAVVIGKDGGSEQIVISASDIKLGASASNYVALANLVAAELANIATALTSIVVTIPTTGAVGLPSAGTGTVVYTPGPVAATIVKAL
jgi:hypothetical protein